MKAKTAVFEKLWAVMQAMGKDVHSAAGDHGPTPMQGLLLDRLADEVAVPQTELARQLQCDNSNLTSLVDALESRGLVQRTTPRHDRRIRAIVTTDSGKELRDRLRRRLHEDNPLLSRLDATETAELSRLLERILE